MTEVLPNEHTADGPSVPATGLSPAKQWILQRQHADMSDNLRAAWTAYIQFYTVFLTLSVVALGWFFNSDVKWSEGVKPFIAWVFAALSALTAITSFAMIWNSRQVADRQREIERELLDIPPAAVTGKPKTAIPVGLTSWAGGANGAAMFLLAALWFYLRNQ